MRRRWLRAGLAILGFCLSAPVLAQSGLPALLTPDLRVYPQFFSSAQADNGDIYLGNNGLVLRFDGGHWANIPVCPGPVRGLVPDGPDQIWVGGSDCFGRVRVSADGRAHFEDLSGQFATELAGRSFADTWDMALHDGVVYFRALHDLFALDRNGRKVLHVHHPGRLGHLASIGTELWLQFRGEGGGLRRLQGSRFDPIEHTEPFASNLVTGLFDLDDGRVLISDTSGFAGVWRSSGLQALPAPGFPDWALNVQGAVRIGPRVFAYGSSDGAVYEVQVGDQQIEINRIPAIDSFVFGMARGIDGALLLTHGHGVTRLPWPRAWQSLLIEGEEPATGFYSIFGEGDSLYLLTWDGVFLRDALGTRRLPFGTNEYWSMLRHRGRLLAAGAKVLFDVSSGEAVPISSDDFYPRTLVPDAVDPDLLWVGTEHGPALMRFQDGRHHLVSRLHRVGWSVFTLAATTSHIYTGSESQGVHVLDRDSLNPDALEFRSMVVPNSEREPSIALSQTTEGIFASSNAGIYRLQAATANHDDLGGLAPLLDDGEQVQLVVHDGTRWAYSFHSVYRQPPGEAWSLVLQGGTQTGPLTALVPLPNGQMLLSGERVLTRYLGDAAPAPALPVKPRISAVTLHKSNGRKTRFALDSVPRFHLDGGNLEFEFAFPNYTNGANNSEFQYRLDRPGQAWSPWSNRASAAFFGLPAGEYRLSLRARPRFGNAVLGKDFSFVIVPHWYQRAWVWPLLMALGGALLAWIMIRRQRVKLHRLRTRNLELDRVVAARTRELEAANEQLRGLASSDGLTGVANRRQFDHSLDEALGFARARGESLGLLMIDVDHFKAFNDAHGHLAGDDVLRQVARVIAAAVPERCLVARFGGEEFAVIAPRTAGQDLIALGEFLRCSIAARVANTTVSIGCAQRNARSPDAKQLIQHADHALYQAKREGRNRVHAAD